MSPKIPALNARDVIRILKLLRFSEVRTKGSHIFFKHSDGRTTLVPKHGGEDIGRAFCGKFLEKLRFRRKNFLSY